MKTENKSTLFTVCHAMTKKLVENTSFDYRATFSACLKLYYDNVAVFVVAAEENDISADIVKKLDNESFDFFTACRENDNETINNCLKIAVVYGLKKRHAAETKKDVENMTANNTLSLDNNNPHIADEMRKEADDLKNDIAIYLLNRADNEKFLKLPFLYQLTRAGDAVVFAEYRKRIRRAAVFGNVESLDYMRENGIEKPFFDKYGKSDLIETIIQNVPEIHRENAGKIIKLRYAYNKSMNIDEIAKRLNISERTVKTILKEIKDIDLNNLY